LQLQFLLAAAVKRFTPMRRSCRIFAPKFVRFTMDSQKRVLDWKSSGKNFAQRKGKTLVNVAIIVGSVAIVTLIIGALAFDDMFVDFSTGLPL